MAGLFGCSQAADGGATSATAEKGIAELKGKLLEALRAKDAQKFFDQFYIAEGFDTPDVRETNLKQIGHLVAREAIDIVTEDISPEDLAEIKAIQDAKPDTRPRYSLFPKKMLLIASNRQMDGLADGFWSANKMAGGTS